MTEAFPCRLLTAIAVASCLACATAAQSNSAAYPSPAAQPSTADARMDWWRDARFGMFIHWGLYAVPAGEWKGERTDSIGEWIMFHKQIPVAEYEPLARQFNPVKFDAARWVGIVKNAGMKYIIITSKHHDGFCLFDSKLTDYDIVDGTPFGRDVLAELAAECRRQGVHLGFYYSIMDWHHPDYLPRRPWDTRPADAADFDRYVEYMKGQLRELVTKYDPAVLWFDGEWEDHWTHERGVDLYEYVRGLKPDILINNRVDKGRAGMAGLTRDGGFVGDFGTPEQEVPGRGLPGVDWESCMTMNDTWGYKSFDENWKSAETLTRTLIDIASKGGNFLLNVGPTGEGEIPAASVERLERMGEWLHEHGESIHGTTAGPIRHLEFEGRCTARGDRLYLHVFDWPERRTLTLKGVRNRVRFAQFLEHFPLRQSRDDSQPAGVKNFGIEQNGETVTIRLPDSPSDPIASVIAVQLDGPPDIDNTFIIRQRDDGSLQLPARLAEVHGHTARYESGHGKDNIGFWTDAADWLSWPLQVEQGGEFEVRLTQATEAGSGGSEFAVEVAGARLSGTIRETGSWTAFETVELGKLRIPPGEHALAVRVIRKAAPAVMNLKQIELRRVAE